jgi:mono/diheme cytochrome c family protein
MTTVLQRSIAIAIVAAGATLAYAADPGGNVDHQMTGNADTAPGGGGSVDQAAAAAQKAYGEDVKKLFATNCSLCHQANGMRQGDGPKLAGTAKSEDQVIEQIKHGKTPMPGFEGKLSEQQIKALARYIKSLPAS